jgi:glycerophosphoryl diester phosphodiesterase
VVHVLGSRSTFSELDVSGGKTHCEEGPGAVIKELPGRTKPFIMAHRGNNVRCPENTLSAFRQALADGADILETDLHQTADGRFVCIHDPTVDRTTDGSGYVAEMRLEEIKRLSAGKGQPAYRDECIPTLEELALITPPNIALALELKSDIFLESSVTLHLVRELDQWNIRDRTIVISFSMQRLLALRRVAPDLPLGRITMFDPLPRSGTELLGPLWPMLFINPFLVRLAHRKGQLVCPLDPFPDKRLRVYRLLQCDALLANDPATTLRAVHRMGWKST